MATSQKTADHAHLEIEAYKKTLKYALATSIIRSKPASLTSKQYATQLADKLRQAESTWKNKAMKVQVELEESKKEIILLKMKNESIMGSYIKDGELNDLKKAPLTSTIEVPHVKNKFFFSVVNIQHWSAILKTNQTLFPTIKNNMLKTFQDFTDSLENMKDNEQCVNLAISSIKLLAELLKQDEFSSDRNILSCCSQIIESIIKCVMTATLCQESMITDVINVLFILSSTCLIIRDIVVEKLSLLINTFTKLLREISCIMSLDLLQYDRMYYMCDMLQRILQATLAEWKCTNIDKYYGLIDEDLFSTGSHFPLYTHSVWYIASVMADYQMTSS